MGGFSFFSDCLFFSSFYINKSDKKKTLMLVNGGNSCLPRGSVFFSSFYMKKPNEKRHMARRTPNMRLGCAVIERLSEHDLLSEQQCLLEQRLSEQDLLSVKWMSACLPFTNGLALDAVTI
jgi:hypothetical protein